VSGSRKALGVSTLAVALLTAACLAPSAPAAPQPVSDGRYAGGSDGFFIYFQVSNRAIPFARVYSNELQDCTGLGGPAVFGSDTIDGKGRFKLTDDATHANSDFVVKGRFVRRTRAKGRVKWTTTADCPAGTYAFDYRVDRYGPDS
jgi:hypothetical protein